jgi:Na+-transporting methylmalonyl-CoA/oxaloacetate decarboxylase beta subunit
MIEKLSTLIYTTGFVYLTPGMVFMWLIGAILIYLSISKQYEPMLLLPIGFGILRPHFAVVPTRTRNPFALSTRWSCHASSKDST